MTKFITLAKQARDRTGQRFARLVMLGPVSRTKSGSVVWLCRCDCGKETTATRSNLLAGHVMSCGCLLRETRIKTKTTHGLTNTDVFKIWTGMRNRCTNSRDPNNFRRYGGRGIYVCDRWVHGDGNKSGVECFVEDMGPRPSKRHSVERRDNNGPYSPDNCEWATRIVQGSNKRNNVVLTHAGISLTVSQWERKRGFRRGVILDRMRGGWDVTRAIDTPLDARRSAWIRAGFRKKKLADCGAERTQ